MNGVDIAFFLTEESEAIAYWESALVVPRLNETVSLPDYVELSVQRVVWTAKNRVEITLA